MGERVAKPSWRTNRSGGERAAEILSMFLYYSVNQLNNIQNTGIFIMPGTVITRIGRTLAFGLCLASVASGQATSPAIKTRTIAEVEIKATEDGREVVRLAPADRVVPGDEVIYTVEIRNTGPAAVSAPTVIKPIPTHMAYVADSATGPGAEVSYSVDGGRTFDRSENLRVMGEDHQMHVAKAIDYTHIRWKLKSVLKSKSVAFARFRAVVR